MNGEKPSNYTAYNSLIASMPQEDIHFPDLTVKQTLDFAIGCKFRAVTPEEKGFASVRTANFLRALRLEHAKDTLVGNDMLRGVSGGEKRRVTMGTSFAGEPRLAMLDEPTTGLDSAAALAVMEVCCEVSKSRFTTIAALLQPSQEIFDLFTHVLVLSEGTAALPNLPDLLNHKHTVDCSSASLLALHFPMQVIWFTLGNEKQWGHTSGPWAMNVHNSKMSPISFPKLLH